MQKPGLRDCEISLLRLIEKVSNGSRIAIDSTGTMLNYKPGVLTGGGYLKHQCHPSAAIGYYLEPLVFLALFGKETVDIDLEGITNDNESQSVDLLRTVMLPFLENFGVDVGSAELKIVRRGAPPTGGGLIHCRIPVVADHLEPVQMTEVGLVHRVRGIAYSARVSPQLANRSIVAARKLLRHVCKDVFIYADHFKGAEAGESPGYGLSLVAETTTGAFLSTERFADPEEASSAVPEELGALVAKQLLHQVLLSGYVDSSCQWVALLLMVLTPRNVSKIVLGRLTPFTIRFIRLLHAFFGTEFKISVVEEPTYLVTLSCVGSGFRNLNRKYT